MSKPTIRILDGDCRASMRELEPGIAQVSVTSPPYYGLRSYGTEPMIWPSDDGECAHDWVEHFARNANSGGGATFKQVTNPGSYSSDGYQEQVAETVAGLAEVLADADEQTVVAIEAAIDETIEEGKREGGGPLPRKPKGPRGRLSHFCRKCERWKGELGAEPSPDLYVTHLLEVFREVRRLLHDTGTLFVNIADCYAGSGKGRLADGTHAVSGEKQQTNVGTIEGLLGKTMGDLPAGNLLRIPERLSIALQLDGWILRSAMVLPKKAPMPQSVLGVRWEKHRIKVKKGGRAANAYQQGAGELLSPQGPGVASRAQREAYELQRDKQAGHGPTADGFNERWQGEGAAVWEDCPGCDKCSENDGLVLRWGSGRPTSAYEMLYAFGKSERYFWNTEGVRRTFAPATLGDKRFTDASLAGSTRRRNVGGRTDGYTSLSPEPESNSFWRGGGNALDWMLWEPNPLAELHYAAFPRFIPAFAIKAGTPDCCCAECGAPYAPVVLRGELDREWQKACGGDENGEYNGQALKDYVSAGAEDASAVKARILAGMRARKTTEWKATCSCPKRKSRPSMVLDPFMGSGTTAVEAQRQGRSVIGCELQGDYLGIIDRRLKDARAAKVPEGQAALDFEVLEQTVTEDVCLPF